MIILGITGGSGCGKTTVSDYFRNNGIDVIDTDKVARLIVEPGQPALSEIKSIFGDEYISADGTLNRKKLGNYVFSHPDKISVLNKITHKYISRYVDSYINSYNGEIIGIDGAALIESGINSKCDFVLSVLSDIKIRTERIKKRDNLTDDEAKCRISAQKDDNFYIENSDFLVYNNNDIIYLHNQLDNILNKLRSKL